MQCWNEYAFLPVWKDYFYTFYNKPDTLLHIPGVNSSESKYVRMGETEHLCDSDIILQPWETTMSEQHQEKDNEEEVEQATEKPKPIVTACKQFSHFDNGSTFTLWS